jgi:hypothetical protein
VTGLSPQDLFDNFYPVQSLADRLFRCAVETPRATTYYYVRLAGERCQDRDWLLVSTNHTDDAFAQFVLTSVPKVTEPVGLRSQPLSDNSYGFAQVVLAGAEWHSNFGGVLDAKRSKLTLCVPAHRHEFSGDESLQEFTVMCRETVPIRDLTRPEHPKIVLRFDNPRTKGGTGRTWVLVSRELLLREIDLLDGVDGAFMEIQNWRRHFLEVLSPEPEHFVLIRDLDDRTREPVSPQTLRDRVAAFLTTDA